MDLRKAETGDGTKGHSAGRQGLGLQRDPLQVKGEKAGANIPDEALRKATFLLGMGLFAGATSPRIA